MKQWMAIPVAALCLSSVVSAQVAANPASPHKRQIQARKVRAAHRNQNQSVMFRARGARAVAPRQTFDNSGNSMLKGTYFVRQVSTMLDPSTSDIDQAVSLTGTMTFDGNGNYTFTGQELDSTVGSTAVAYTTTGTYAVSNGGQVQISTPIDADSGDTEFGGVGANGEVIASATEGEYDDIFVAIPQGPASGVTGTYNVGFIDYTMGNADDVRNGYFSMTASGGNSFGNVTVNGQMANQGSTATTQSLSGVTYSFSGTTGTITFPTSSNTLSVLITGPKTFAVSPDGNILVGGNPNGFDLFVGVEAASGVTNATYANTYFTAALENPVDSCGQTNCMDSFYGSSLPNTLGQGTEHERQVGFDFNAFDYTSDLPYGPFPSNGSYNDGAEFQWFVGPAGEAVVQVGMFGYYTLIPQFQAAAYSGSGVFLNPDGIVNAASFAPITNSVAPGEYVAIFGTDLATTAAAPSLPLPDTLGGAAAMVNSTPAPMLAASSTLVTMSLPGETEAAEGGYGFAVFQIGSSSNSVTLYTASTAPGVFTSTANGVGPADAFHANYTYVTSTSPGAIGEGLFFYATGLGATSPVVADGAAAPTSPLATVTDPNFEVDIFDSTGNDTFVNAFTAVLAPGLAGVYQVNFTVPSGVAAGECYLDVGTTDGFTSMAKIYIQ
jgi:uncharacterized protein (TIGR03437 family)